MDDPITEFVRLLESSSADRAPADVLRLVHASALESTAAGAGRLVLTTASHHYVVGDGGVVVDTRAADTRPATGPDRWIVPIRLHGRELGYFDLAVAERRRTGDRRARLRHWGVLAALVVEHSSTQIAGECRRRWLQASYELLAAIPPTSDADAALRQLVRSVRHLTGARRSIGVRGDTADVVPLAEDGDELHWSDRSATTLDFRLSLHVADAARLILVFDPTGVVPGEAELLELEAFLATAALLVDRAQAVANERRLALAHERNRIARELHDGAIQQLFGAGLELQALQALTQRDDWGDRVDHLVTLVDAVIVDLRRTIAALVGDALMAPA